VRICFPDATTQRVFNDFQKLEQRYGPVLAIRIATRLSVLAAARQLSLVPRRAPIRLRCHDNSRGAFTVDLSIRHRLSFHALDISTWLHTLDKSAIEEIEVTGVCWGRIPVRDNQQRRRSS
jgi:hypothetical protein